MQEEEMIKPRKEKIGPNDLRTGHPPPLPASAFQIFKDWINSFVLPPSVALGAIVLAAFLLFRPIVGLSRVERLMNWGFK